MRIGVCVGDGVPSPTLLGSYTNRATYLRNASECPHRERRRLGVVQGAVGVVDAPDAHAGLPFVEGQVALVGEERAGADAGVEVLSLHHARPDVAGRVLTVRGHHDGELVGGARRVSSEQTGHGDAVGAGALGVDVVGGRVARVVPVGDDHGHRRGREHGLQVVGGDERARVVRVRHLGVAGLRRGGDGAGAGLAGGRCSASRLAATRSTRREREGENGQRGGDPTSHGTAFRK